MVQLTIWGKGGKVRDVDVPFRPLRHEVKAYCPFPSEDCPFGCALTLECTGEAGQKVGIKVRYLCKDDNVSSPLELAIPVDTSHRDVGQTHSQCPGCSQHLCLSIRGVDLTSTSLCVNGLEPQREQFAFVATLWAPENKKDNGNALLKYITQALVLGHSLAHTCRVQKRILLVTKAVVEHPAAVPLHIFWELRIIEELVVHPSRISKCEQRFKGVFTKLRAWDLTDFAKVVLLDLDILVRKNIDDFFSIETPAAVCRGHDHEDAPGSVRDGAHLFDRDGQRGKGGINAGVMILRPSSSEYTRMKLRLQEKGPATSMPEQDFLSEWFNGNWVRLPVKHNYQLHQLGYLEEPGRKCKSGHWERAEIDLSDVTIAHFSGDYGPDDYLFEKHWPGEFEDYLKNTLLGKYGVYSGDFQQRVFTLCKEWYSAWKDMWQDVIARVKDPWSEQDAHLHNKCPACGAHEIELGLSFEHVFLSCKSVRSYGDNFKEHIHKVHPDVLKSGWREAILSERVFSKALLFISQVAAQRVRYKSDLHEERRVGEMPANRCSVVSPGQVMLLHTGSAASPKGGGRGRNRRGGPQGNGRDPYLFPLMLREPKGQVEEKPNNPLWVIDRKRPPPIQEKATQQGGGGKRQQPWKAPIGSGW